MEPASHGDCAPPRIPSALQVRLVRTLMGVPPLRSPWVRRQLVSARRELQRRRRRRLEARGDDRLSRPSLYGMTERLLEYLPERDGFFVEAGAFDGFAQSNTYWLERFRGWRGIMVEPVPDLHREAVRERPAARVFNCALVAADYDAPTVTMRFGGLMSLVAGSKGSERAEREYLSTAFLLGIDEAYDVEVPARTLSSILDEVDPPRVDLLSLDVEGFEPAVLRGLDLERHAPRYMLIEIQDAEDGRRAIEAVIGERYVAVDRFSPMDLLYARRDEAEIRARTTSRTSSGTAPST